MPERVHVAARIRPFLHTDPDDADLTTIVVDNTHISVGAQRVFAVDRVYRMEDDTDTVYDELVRPIVDDFLRGYNGAVMAYGQTGTGKTFTMNGLVPLVLEHIVHGSFLGEASQLAFQYVEVYGEALRDLLSADPITSTKALTLYDTTGVNGEGGCAVVGAVTARAQTLKDVLLLFERGARMRATGATSIHEHSSRSHSIFTILNERDHAKLHLVDLAGSERNKKTHNVGLRFQESIGINSGLLALGNVIRALSRNSTQPSALPSTRGEGSGSGGGGAVESTPTGHVPYRSSKLTRLLQDTLGGNSKTLFIACVAPDSYNRDETVRTLQYCALAMRVLNEPVKRYEELYETQRGHRRRTRDAAVKHATGRAGSGASPHHGQEEEQEQDRRKASPSPVSATELSSTCTALHAQLKEKELLVAALVTANAQLQNRLHTCEEELAKDEQLFSRQIAEMRKVLHENAALRERIAFLEGRPVLANRAANAARVLPPSSPLLLPPPGASSLTSASSSGGVVAEEAGEMLTAEAPRRGGSETRKSNSREVPGRLLPVWQDGSGGGDMKQLFDETRRPPPLPRPQFFGVQDSLEMQANAASSSDANSSGRRSGEVVQGHRDPSFGSAAVATAAAGDGTESDLATDSSSFVRNVLALRGVRLSFSDVPTNTSPLLQSRLPQAPGPLALPPLSVSKGHTHSSTAHNDGEALRNGQHDKPYAGGPLPPHADVVPTARAASPSVATALPTHVMEAPYRLVMDPLSVQRASFTDRKSSTLPVAQHAATPSAGSLSMFEPNVVYAEPPGVDETAKKVVSPVKPSDVVGGSEWKPLTSSLDARDDQLSALAKTALQYRASNVELWNKLSSAVTLLESQQREAALMRLELDQIRLLLDGRAE